MSSPPDRAPSALDPRCGIYAGSFDPPTLGHLDMVRRGAALFDRLLVAVGDNPAKRTWFSAAERCELVQACVGDLPGVQVVAFSGLLIDACKAHGAGVILRGLRGPADLELELRNGMANRDLAGIDTVFLLSDPAHVFVSSSLVREVAGHGGDAGRWLPAAVAGPVAERARQRLGASGR